MYLIKYIGVGALNTLIGFTVIFMLMGYGLSALTSNVLGYLVGIALGFFLSKIYVFESQGKTAKEATGYIISFLLSFSVNLIVLQVSLKVFHFGDEVSQILAALSYAVLMFLFSCNLVFVDKKKL